MYNEIVFEIDFEKIGNLIRKWLLLLLAIAVICGGIGWAVSEYFVPKSYTASASIIIVPDTNSENSLTYNDVQLSQKLTSTYSRILLSEAVGDKVIKNLKLNFSPSVYKSIMSVSSSGGSEVLDIKATTSDRELSAKIVNEAVEVFKKQVFEIMNIKNVSVLDYAKIPERAAGPNVKRNVLLGIACGVIVDVLFVVICSLKDNKVKSEKELESILKLPVIGTIPEYNQKIDREGQYGRC